jgi:O-antigen/teichoic acid export membrane protein
VFASLLSILSIVASLRYQLAIPLPKTDEEAANVTVLSLAVVVCIASLTAAVVIPLSQTIASALNIPLLAGYLWLLPLGLLLVGTYEVLNYWAIRKRAFGAIAQTKLTQSLGTVGIQIGGYTLGPTALLIGRVVGQAAGLYKLGAMLIRDRRRFAQVRVSGIKASLKDYRSFPLVSTWSGLSSAGGAQLPPLLIAIIIGPVAAGLYALTHRVLSLPIGVISKSMGDVFYSEAVEAKLQGTLGSLVVDIYYKMVAASLPIAMVLIISAPEVFSVVFGENWVRSGELASWMSFGVFFQFVTTPPGRVFLILERHGYALIFQLAFLLTTAASIIIGGWWFNDIITIVAILTFGRSVVYCCRFWKILDLVDEDAQKLWIPLVKYLPYSILCALPALFGFYMLDPSENYLYIKIVLFVLSVLMSVVPPLKLVLK